ncbi:MAG: phenylacetate--CoA ligase family protein [Kiritimatiellia bacterium]
MKLYPIIRDAWGQLRGYRRWSIRRAVACTMRLSPEEVAARSAQLARARYRRALQQFPAYAELVRQHTGQADIESLPFEQLPILSKSDLRQIQSTVHAPFRAFRVFRGSKIIRHSTGGSTGQPFSFYITRESYEWRTAVSDRGYSWALAEEGRRSFYVWGTAIRKPGRKQRIKENLHHWLQNRYYFDSFDFTDARKAECCRQINRFKPVSLVGYSGNLIELARYVARNPGVLTWRAPTCVTAAEGLRPGMREWLETHLADEVFISYGSREFMLIGMEGRDHDGYLLSADNLYVEVVDDTGQPCGPGQTGRIVVTDLHNEATPFVRYEIGDMGKAESGKQKAEIEQEGTEETKGVGPDSLRGTGHGKGTQREVASGEWTVESGNVNEGGPLSPTISTFDFQLSAFPKLASVEGRLQEVIVRADGEQLTALFVPHLMKEFPWVDGYQVVQEAPGKITLHLVTQDVDWVEKAREIERTLREKLGAGMRISMQRVEQLQKTASGKTPIVRNRR